MTEEARQYENSCLNGSEIAQTNVGIMFMEGKYVQKNEKKAFELFSQAAKNNDYRALFELGYCYEYEIATKKDLNKAKYYYELGEKKAKLAGRTVFDLEYFKAVIKRNDIYTKNQKTEAINTIKKQTTISSSNQANFTPIYSQITGKIVRVCVKSGTMVKPGDVIAVANVNNREYKILAIVGGMIQNIKINNGDYIEKSNLLAVIAKK